ncbi:P-loop NTPase fold protein [Pedobacter sp. Leaf194]|uniref:P-loop NTPase fold protein n=2 Tax=Pseudomonadati TaxID=3379134 RepID=UPI000ADED2AF|nr:P-loop NTPase fold protein [Pedobacter sp. Leaf194]
MKNSDEPNFLSNVPLGEDLFEGKSQEKIAIVLEKVLTRDKFHIVGIDGGWGTGKSNLVSMLSKRMKNHSFFIYDVWGHQEDDQRRSILVELTEHLCKDENKLIEDKEKWKGKYKRLLSKEKEVTTINRPSLSIGFILSLFLIVYVPSVTAFAKDMSLSLLKFVVVLFPLFLILLIFIWKWIQHWSRNNFKTAARMALQETFQVYQNKQVDETKIETIAESDPSVSDFKQWMGAIDSDLGKKKLILVFDNFDRLPKKNILSIWSSIHIFFSEVKYDNIKVIVPFDRAHIKNAFKEGSSTEDYANDYINKTFDLVYRVSPPIMSDWKIFFKNCWDKAFANGDEEEYLKVEQIYEVFRPSITPREIIAFINEVVSIRLLEPGVPDRYIALFVLNKEAILKDPLAAIVTAEFLSGLSYLYKDEEDFQKYITALSYQINPENSLEVVYRKQLKESLVNGEEKQFKTISNTNIFDKILSTVIGEIENYEVPIATLNALDESKKISDVHLAGIWQNIYFKVLKIPSKQFEFEKHQWILLTKINSVQQTIYLKSILSGLYSHESFESVKFSALITTIAQFLEHYKIEIDVYELLKERQVPAAEFINLVKNQTSDYGKFSIICDPEQLNNLLIGTPLTDFEEFDFLQYISKDYDLKHFNAFITEEIPGNYNQPKNLAGMLEILKVSADSPFGISLSDDQIYSAFSTTTEKDDLYYDLLAMRVAKAQSFSSSYATYFAAQMSADDDEVAEKVATVVEYYTSYGNLLENSIELITPSLLYESVVRKVVQNDYNTNSANVLDLLEIFEQICSTNKLDPKTFLDDLSRWQLPQFNPEKIITYPNYYFEHAIGHSSELAKASIETVKKYYDGLDTVQWKALFADLTAKNAELLFIIRYDNWNSFALDAFKEILIDTASTGVINTGQRMQRLIESLIHSGKDLSGAFKDFRDELIDKRTISAELFRFFGQLLFSYAGLNERSADVFRTILKSMLLDDADCLHILVSNSELIKQMLTQQGNDFAEAVRDRMENEEISIFGHNLGLRKGRADD